MYPMHPEDADFTYSSAVEIDRAHARSGCDPDPAKCVCRGRGWIGSERDSHYTCLAHYTGQTHPEMYDPYDDMTPEELEAERKRIAEDYPERYSSGTDDSLPF